MLCHQRKRRHAYFHGPAGWTAGSIFTSSVIISSRDMPIYFFFLRWWMLEFYVRVADNNTMNACNGLIETIVAAMAPSHNEASWSTALTSSRVQQTSNWSVRSVQQKVRRSGCHCYVLRTTTVGMCTRLLPLFSSRALFTFQKILQNFSHSPSHRIFRRMHGVLNIDENKN